MDPAAVDQDPPVERSEKTLLEYEVESFQRYLDLPWDNLENFTKAVKAYEEKFEKDLQEHLKDKSKNPEDEERKSAITEFYLRNVFHLFNHPSAESPTSLQAALQLDKFLHSALTLLKQKDWDDVKDKFGAPIGITTILGFLEELTKRLFNLNFVFPKAVHGSNIGSTTLHSKYSELLSGLGEMHFRLVEENKAKFLNNLYEVHYYYLRPQNIFRPKFGTAEFRTSLEKRVENKPLGNNQEKKAKKESSLKDELLTRIRPYLTNLFVDFILPNYPQARGSMLEAETELSVNIHLTKKSPALKSFTNQSDVLLKKASEVFDLALTKAVGLPDLSIWLEGETFFENDFEKQYKVCLVEFKNENKLADLAEAYFKEQPRPSSNSAKYPTSTGTGRTASILDKVSSTVSTRINKNKRKAILLSEDSENPPKNDKDTYRFGHFLRQSCSYCKLNGTPLCVLSNSDELIVLRVRDFYEKINQDVYQEDPKDLKLFDLWDVTIFNRADTKYSTMSVLASLVLEECRHFLNNKILSNTQIGNWHITYGSSTLKHTLDKIRYLASRSIFHVLIKKKFFTRDSLQLNFQWNKHFDFNGSGLTLNSWNKFVSKVLSIVRKSDEWKTYGKAENKQALRILDSTNFKILKTLKNETWCENLSATTMTGVFGKGSTTTVLKFFDVNRMAISSRLEIEVSNAHSQTLNYETVLGISYKSWFKELTAYQLLKGKKYIPELIDSGFLSIPDLDPSTLKNDINLYENVLQRTGRELKTEAPFIELEFIERLDAEAMLDVDFDKLKEQAKKDLKDMNKEGVFHCDVHPRNLIIRKNASGNYRVMFIDFGESIIYKSTGRKKGLKQKKALSEKKDLVEAIEFYENEVKEYKKTHNILEV